MNFHFDTTVTTLQTAPKQSSQNGHRPNSSELKGATVIKQELS